MKKYYEINIAYRGAVETITPLTKKEKNVWLLYYFTQGDGRSWALQRYRDYLERWGVDRKVKMTFEKFVFRTLKDENKIVLTGQNKIILIREKYFEKPRKNA
jgi:hypothetical protein